MGDVQLCMAGLQGWGFGGAQEWTAHTGEPWPLCFWLPRGSPHHPSERGSRACGPLLTWPALPGPALRRLRGGGLEPAAEPEAHVSEHGRREPLPAPASWRRPEEGGGALASPLCRPCPRVVAEGAMGGRSPRGAVGSGSDVSSSCWPGAAGPLKWMAPECSGERIRCPAPRAWRWPAWVVPEAGCQGRVRRGSEGWVESVEESPCLHVGDHGVAPGTLSQQTPG